MLTAEVTKTSGQVYDDSGDPDLSGRTTHIVVDLGSPDHTPYQVIYHELATDRGVTGTMRVDALGLQTIGDEDALAGRGWLEYAAIALVMEALDNQANADQSHAGDDQPEDEDPRSMGWVSDSGLP